jgi:hypothetical protein
MKLATGKFILVVWGLLVIETAGLFAQTASTIGFVVANEAGERFEGSEVSAAEAITVSLSEPAAATLRLFDPQGDLVALRTLSPDEASPSMSLYVPVTRWRPDIYLATLEVEGEVHQFHLTIGVPVRTADSPLPR